jgi:serine/threonine protein kinase
MCSCILATLPVTSYEDEQNFFIEMEYADGGTLRSLIGDREGGRLFPESAVLWYAYQLLSGLEHVHQANILHR